MSRDMVVCAVVLLTRKGLDFLSLEQVSAGQALLTLAPSTLFNLPGLGKTQLAGMASLASRVPCYEMHLSADLDANCRALRALLYRSGLES